MRRYRTVPVRADIVSLLQSAEQQIESAESLSGSVLFLLARATHRTRILVAGHKGVAAALWLALACEPDGQVTYLAPRVEPLVDSAAAGLPITTAPALGDGPCYDMVVIAGETVESPPRLVERLCPEGLLVLWETDEVPRILEEWREANPAWRIVRVGASSYLAGAGARAPRFAESPREALLALLLQAAGPGTVVLGPNVVFDGAAKPPTSKISFSGTGGQIGAGDWLIVYPDDLERYSPLPGAVALVLGAVTAPIDAPHAALMLPTEESGQVTLVVAMT